MTIGVRTNDFPAVCWRCKEGVPAGRGSVMGEPGNWKVQHVKCIPHGDRPWLNGLEYDL